MRELRECMDGRKGTERGDGGVEMGQGVVGMVHRRRGVERLGRAGQLESCTLPLLT